MTVRSVFGRHLSGGTEGIAIHPFDALRVRIGCHPFRRNRSAKLLIIGIDFSIRTAQKVYIQETVNFMRAFRRRHAC